MESIVIRKRVKEESDLLQFDAKKILARLLDSPDQSMFPLSERIEIMISLSIELRHSPCDGVIAS